MMYARRGKNVQAAAIFRKIALLNPDSEDAIDNYTRYSIYDPAKQVFTL